MPSSFSSEFENAKSFSSSDSDGIILHISDKDISNAVSVRGLSEYPDEDEILVNDTLWNVSKVYDKDSRRHIILKRKTGE